MALCGAAPVHADPAQPGDYRAEVVEIDPPTPSLDARIVGGDSFVQLRVASGSEAFVLGYENEDYLWFRNDGAVFENRASPAAYLNASRYGAVSIPPTASADADPDWHRVADDGTFVWHDHRAHWMQHARPPGKAPGDVIVDATIPVRVDDTIVEIRVVSTWEHPPSIVAPLVGTLAGLAAGVVAITLARAGRPAVYATVVPALGALAAGAWQYFSLPAATGPRLAWVALPAIAVVCAVAGAVFATARSSFFADAALLAVGAELTMWGVLRRDVIGAAVIPTAAPFWLDRAATAMALSAGIVFVGVALWLLFVAGVVSGSRAPTDSPRPVRP